MKIALIGTHGIGKTTIVYELAAALKKKGENVGILSEVVRDCPLPVNEQATKEAQKWILFTQIARELELESKYKILICDRSVLDDYAYFFNKFGEDAVLEHLISEYLKTYSFLFKVPIRNFLINDGFRSVDFNFQKEIDEKLSYLLEKFNQKCISFESIDKALDLIHPKA